MENITPSATHVSDVVHDLNLPDIGRSRDIDSAGRPHATVEPTNEELRSQELGGLEPWVFDREQLKSALYTHSELLQGGEDSFAIKSLVGNVQLMNGLTIYYHDEVLAISDGDQINPAEKELIVLAREALDSMREEEYEDSSRSQNNLLSRTYKLGAGAAAAIGGGLGIGGWASSLPYMTATGAAGVLAGAAAWVGGSIWQYRRDENSRHERARYVADVFQNIESKLRDSDGVTTVQDLQVSIDLKKAKKLPEAQYPGLKETAQYLMEGDFGYDAQDPRQLLAAMFQDWKERVISRDFRPRKHNLTIDMQSVVTQLLRNVHEVDDTYVDQLWRGDERGYGLRTLVTAVEAAQESLDEHVTRGVGIRAIDDEWYMERVDRKTEKILKRRKGELQQDLDIAVLRLLKLRREVAHHLGSTRSAVPAQGIWPLLSVAE